MKTLQLGLMRFILIFYCLFLFVGNYYSFTQDIPKIISYQGVLVDAEGKPINDTKTIIFRFVDAEVGGNELGKINPRILKVQGGLFFTLLGNENGEELPKFDKPTWLEVETDGKKYRVQLTASVYALNIPDKIVTTNKLADNSVTSEKIKDGEIKADDLSDMGANDGQILVRRQNTWVGEKLPETVPVGTVLPYMGDDYLSLKNLEKEGWFLCDGRLIASLDYLTDAEKTNLQLLLQRAGNPEPGKLPDLRGMFLRGANRNRTDSLYIDPDFSLRPGTGYKIGSVQLDALQDHKHIQSFWFHQYTNESWAAGGPDLTSKNLNSNNRPKTSGVTDSRFSSETRPKNVYVNFIIKAR